MKILVRVIIPVISLIVSFFMLDNIAKAANGLLVLHINTGFNSCIYGTSLDLGSQTANLTSSLIFSGQFTGTNSIFSCTSLNGNNVSLTMQISGDLTNISNTNYTIPASNIELQTFPNHVTAGDCFTGIGTTTRTPIDSPQVIVSKIGNPGQVCTVSSTGVLLKITTSIGQAVGLYAGTLVFTMY